MNAAKTLKSVLAIIDQDVKLIKKRSKAKRLSAEDATLLTRYANTLNVMLDEKEKEKEKVRNDLKKKPTEELIQLWLEQQKKQKGTNP